MWAAGVIILSGLLVAEPRSRPEECLRGRADTVMTLLRHHRRLDLLVERSQTICGHLTDHDLAAVVVDLHGLPSAVPDVLTPGEQHLVRGVLGQVFSRIVCAARLEKRADLTRAFLIWSASALTSGVWRTEWASLVNYCAAALGENGPRDGRRPSDWVARVLGVIQARYRDPRLRLSIVAKVADLSPWHVARTLKSQTGQGFVAHLREVRVSAARRLLAEDVLSVKEIAVEVGYAHPNRLDRDFMRVCHMTPSSFRNATRKHARSQ
jgi:AraC-like DNA-binding protein